MKKSYVSCLAVLALGFMGSCSDDDLPTEPVATETQEIPGDSGSTINTPASAAASSATSPANSQTKPSTSAPGSSSSSAATQAATGGEMYVTSRFLNVRSGPGKNNKVVSTLKFKQKVSVLGKEGYWAKIGNGQYVFSTNLSPKMPSVPISEPQPATPAPKP